MSDTATPAAATPDAPAPAADSGEIGDPLGDHFGKKGLQDTGHREPGRLHIAPIKIAPIRDDKGKFTGEQSASRQPAAADAPAAGDDFAAEVAAPVEPAAPPAPVLSEFAEPIEIDGQVYTSAADLKALVQRMKAGQAAADTVAAQTKRSMDELKTYLESQGLTKPIDFTKGPANKEVALPSKDEPILSSLFDTETAEGVEFWRQAGEDKDKYGPDWPAVLVSRAVQQMEGALKKLIEAQNKGRDEALAPHQAFLAGMESVTRTAEFFATQQTAVDANGVLKYPDIRDKRAVREITTILDSNFSPENAHTPQAFEFAVLKWRASKGAEGVPTPKMEVPQRGPSEAAATAAAAAVGGRSQGPSLRAEPKNVTPEDQIRARLKEAVVTRSGFRV